jgi:hypothetical protein
MLVSPTVSSMPVKSAATISTGESGWLSTEKRDKTSGGPTTLTGSVVAGISLKPHASCARRPLPPRRIMTKGTTKTFIANP